MAKKILLFGRLVVEGVAKPVVGIVQLKRGKEEKKKREKEIYQVPC